MWRPPLPTESPTRLAVLRARVAVACTRCGCCVRECAFLERHGAPEKLALEYDPSLSMWLDLPFACSLCGLCAAVCPEEIDPAALFLEMRREAVRRGAGRFPGHRRLLRYEARGTSRRYTWYALPRACDTVFFPGCSLPGSRPGTVLQAFADLRRRIPGIGIVLDCCTKPSHDLGREEAFAALFGELTAFLLDRGVRRVLVACPNCLQVFREHAPELECRTLYELLAEEVEPKEGGNGEERIFLHDPCVARFETDAQQAVRHLAREQGLHPVDPPHASKTTLCCGAGGAVDGVAPELARTWTERRLAETRGEGILTYCASCTRRLGGGRQTRHVLDLLYPSKVPPGWKSRAPFTYLNRLRLKRRLRKEFPAAVVRERTFRGPAAEGGFRRLLERILKG